MIRHERVEKLLDLIEKGPTWKFHSFMRSIALTNQGYLIRAVGLDPMNYCPEDELSLNITVSTENPNEITRKRPIEDATARSSEETQEHFPGASASKKRRPPTDHERSLLGGISKCLIYIFSTTMLLIRTSNLI